MANQAVLRPAAQGTTRNAPPNAHVICRPNTGRKAPSHKRARIAVSIAMLCFVCMLGPLAHAMSVGPNPGDPLFCQPNEGTTFLIVNGGNGVFTVDPDCFNNTAANDTQLTITTGQGGTLNGTVTPEAINYIYTPPTPSFTGLDTFSINVTTVFNSAGGTGSAGGTVRPGGPATLNITLNVLPATVSLQTPSNVAALVPVPAGSVSSCTAAGNASAGPAAGAVLGCVNGIVASVAPSHGTLSTSSNTLTYTPTTGFTGMDTFEYEAYGVNTDGARALNSGNVTVNAMVGSEDFTLGGSNGSSLTSTIEPGGTANYSFSIAPVDNTTSFPTPVTLSVSGQPAGSTVVVTPLTWTQVTSTSWSLPANTALTNIGMSIQVPSTWGRLREKVRPWQGVSLIFGGVLLLPFAGKVRRWRKLAGRNGIMLLMLAIALTVMAGMGGCSSASGHFGPPQATYTVTVTATAGTLSHSTSVSLTVE